MTRIRKDCAVRTHSGSRPASFADRRRAETLRHLIAEIESRTGIPPTNDELAQLLARSPARIARLRGLIREAR